MGAPLEPLGGASGGGQASTVLELFVAGDNLLSRRARANIAQLIAELGLDLPLKVVDVLAEPRVALTRRIFATPALVVSTGGRAQMVAGDLSDRAAVLAALPRAK